MQDSPDKEWRRLTDHYGGMYDEELLELARGYKDLTEMAQQVLRDEMKKRGLGEPLAPRQKAASQPISGPAGRSANLPASRRSSVREETAPADPRAEEDRLRFAAHYATLGDDDLLDLADDIDSLTEGAQFALGQELEKRGLGSMRSISEEQDNEESDALTRAEEREAARQAAPLESETDGPGEYSWKTDLCEFETRAEAVQRMEMLRRAGIESWFVNPAAYFADPYAQPATYRISVAADELEEAQRVIANPVPADIVELSESAPEFEMPTCPRCHAGDPVLIDTEPADKWLCESCGHEWSDAKAAQTPA